MWWWCLGCYCFRLGDVVSVVWGGCCGLVCGGFVVVGLVGLVCGCFGWCWGVVGLGWFGWVVVS